MILAVHGLPTSPALWARLPFAVDAPWLRGVDDDAAFSIARLAAELAERVDDTTVLLGHDLGGPVAAAIASLRRVRALVLTGTALGPYWWMVRATAMPLVHRYFYERHGGRKFLRGSVSPGLQDQVVEAFPPVPPARMRAIAMEMRQPAPAIDCPVHLVWGREDRWYPPWVAHALSRRFRSPIRWVDGGHLCMWENPGGFAAALSSALEPP